MMMRKQGGRGNEDGDNDGETTRRHGGGKEEKGPRDVDVSWAIGKFFCLFLFLFVFVFY
jgi:hypothetical protein